jgi:hypothetical protein
MKLIVYALLGMLLSMFGIGVMDKPGEFFVILATVLLIDYLPNYKVAL